MLSYLSKSAFKIALEEPQKNIAKSTKNNCPAFLSISEALTINPPTFWGQLSIVSFS